jgi:hypothetical protein
MPCVEFEPTIRASERAKTVHALDRAATVIGRTLDNVQKIDHSIIISQSRIFGLNLYKQMLKTTQKRRMRNGKLNYQYKRGYVLNYEKVGIIAE